MNQITVRIEGLEDAAARFQDFVAPLAGAWIIVTLHPENRGQSIIEVFGEAHILR